MSFVVALLLFNFFCDEVLRSIVHDFHVDLPLNLVDLSRPLCKCKFLEPTISSPVPGVLACPGHSLMNSCSNAFPRALQIHHPLTIEKQTSLYGSRSYAKAAYVRLPQLELAPVDREHRHAENGRYQTPSPKIASRSIAHCFAR